MNFSDRFKYNNILNSVLLHLPESLYICNAGKINMNMNNEEDILFPLILASNRDYSVFKCKFQLIYLSEIGCCCK